MSLFLAERPTALQGPCLETVWREKAQNLGLAQLETSTWEDLHKALDAAASGRRALVSKWIDTVEDTFLKTWESYEKSDVLEHEVTAESVLGHRFLQEGIEGWLEALAAFRESLETGLNRSEILAAAETAQRLLIVVQMVEQESQSVVDHFLAAWAN